jgi:hypothetical protein
MNEEPRPLLFSAMAALRMNEGVCLNAYDIEFVCIN